MNDSWSSDPPEERQRRADRHGDRSTDTEDRRVDAVVPPAPAGRERYPWIGLGFLLVGLGAGAVALALIARDLDRPGVTEVDATRWWIVVGGGLAVAWAAPWFLTRRTRRRMAIALGVCTAVVVAVAAVAIGGLER